MFGNSNKLSFKTYYPILVFFILYAGLIIISANNSFFWDTIQLASKHAHWFYENNFQHFFLPDLMDSGHIPIFGMYLALVWMLFGKTLIVSHLSMLPFAFGIIWQSYILVKRFVKPKFIFLAMLLLLADTTLLSQLTLVSPDIPLMFCFILGLNALLKNNRFLLSIAILSLFAVSMRGMMSALALLTVDLFVNVNYKTTKNIIRQLLINSLAYLPAIILAGFYFIFHYVQKGWIGYHEDSPWAACFVRASLSENLRNVFILIWRFIDFGRVFIWLCGFVLILKLRKNLFKDKQFKIILFTLFAIICCLSVSVIIYKNLSGHRYLMPIYFIATMSVNYLIFNKIKNTKIIYIIYITLIVGLTSGNLWIYPNKTAQGWDSTLAHQPYYKLRNKTLNYIDSAGIDYSDIGSVFPNISKLKYTELNNSEYKFAKKDFKYNKYIIYSNIFNDFTDNEIDILKNEWILEKEFTNMRIFVQLYKKPNQ